MLDGTTWVEVLMTEPEVKMHVGRPKLWGGWLPGLGFFSTPVWLTKEDEHITLCITTHTFGFKWTLVGIDWTMITRAVLEVVEE